MPQQYTRAELAQRIKSKYPSYAEIEDNELVDKIVSKYPQYGEQLVDEGKTEELQTEDAAVVPENGASSGEEDFSAEQHNKIAEATQSAYAQIAKVPEFLAEPLAAFTKGLFDVAGGVVSFGEQQAARFDDEFMEQVEEASPEERVKLYEEYSNIGDTIKESADALGQTQAVYGSGSISTEFAEGNYSGAGGLIAQQTASGLASLIPFAIPGGAVLGPIILGTSAAGGAFEEDLETRDVALNDIYNASYAKGGIELATEFVTAGIIGKAGKLAAGGAAREAVNAATRSAWKSVAGDALSEGVSEGLADTGSKLVDTLIYGDEFDFKEATVGFIDSAIVGAIIGGKVSTYGQLHNNKEVGKGIVDQALRTDEQIDSDDQAAKKWAQNNKIIQDKTPSATEGSLIDQALVETAKEENSAIEQELQQEHKLRRETNEELTAEELNIIATNKDKATKLQKELDSLEKKEDADPDVVESIQRKVTEYKEVAESTQNRVRQNKEVEAEVDRVVKKNEEVIEDKQAFLNDAKVPTITAEGKKTPKTEKQKLAEKKARAEIKQAKKNIKDVKKTVERPGHVSTKLGKFDTTNTTEGRKGNNEKLVKILNDPKSTPSQTQTAENRAIEENKGAIESAVAALGLKNKADQDIARNIASQEILRKIKNYDSSKNDNIGAHLLNGLRRKVRSSYYQQTADKIQAQKITQEQQEELDHYQGLLNEGTINQDEFNELELQLKNEYANKTSLDEGPEVTAGIEAEVSKPKEQVDRTENTNKVLKVGKKLADDVLGSVGNANFSKGKVDKSTIDKVKEKLQEQIDNIVKEANPASIFALLPEGIKLGKAFGGLFADGLPTQEEVDTIFKGSDRKSRDARNKLKNDIAEGVAETYAEQALTTDNVNSGAEFLQSKKVLQGEKSIKDLLPLLGKLKRSFPDNKIIINKAALIEKLIEGGYDPGKADGIKGALIDGTIYINNVDFALDFETPIHEFGHIWAKTTSQSNPALYAKGVELVKGSKIWTELVETAKDPDSVYHGYSQEQLAEEAIATAIGRHGEQMFENSQDQSKWNEWVSKMYEWLGKKLNIDGFDTINLQDFLNIAATEIITGKKIITPTDIRTSQKSLATEFRVNPSVQTQVYSRPDAPVVEIDTHGSFKGTTLNRELTEQLDKYAGELNAGGWINWVTGAYGDAVPAHKRNEQLNSRIETKVEKTKESLKAKGYSFKRDPKNPGIHIISKPSFEFSEQSPSDRVAAFEAQNLLEELKSEIDGFLGPNHSLDHNTREQLNATRVDINSRGDKLTLHNLTNLRYIMNDAVLKSEAGVEKIKKEQQKSREEAEKFVTDTTVEVSGVKALEGDVTKDQVKSYNKGRNNYLRDLKQGKLLSVLARVLSPATNNDFYGLLHDMLPKGKNRGSVQSQINERLIKPLEKANLDYLNEKRKLMTKWNLAKKALGDFDLEAPSGITLDNPLTGDKTNLSTSQAIKVFNYIKDPALHGQLTRGNIDAAKMEEVVDYVLANPKLAQYSLDVAAAYSEVGDSINTKLLQHGRESFDKARIDQTELDGPMSALLKKAYGGTIPGFAPYTPVTADGQENATTVDNLIKDGDYTNYTVMDGRLKERTGGGEISLYDTNLDSDFQSYLTGPVRTLTFMDFAQNASQMFGTQPLRKMEAAFGPNWTNSMRDSLRRIVTGRARSENAGTGNKIFNNWINYTVGGIMFFNVRSAVLQHISAANYIVDNPGTTVKGLSAPKAVKNKVKEYLKDSAWIEDRGQGRTDLALDEIFNEGAVTKAGKYIKRLQEKGYSFTKWGDKNAILVGGAPFMTGKFLEYQEQGLSEDAALEAAYQDFVAKAEETQQSTRQERLGGEQKTALGKLVLAFANTQQQYNRKMARAVKNIAAGQDIGQNVRTLLYYGGIQNATFNGLQQLAFFGVGLRDDDDGPLNTANSIADTILRGIGIWGAVIASAKNALIAVSRDKSPVASLINISPAIGTKVRNIEKALGTKKLYAQSDLAADLDDDTAAAIYRIGAAGNVVNLPTDRVIALAEQAADVVASDLDFLQRIMRAGGWSRYNIGENAQGSPLNRETVGQAFNDGTIQVDPDLSPVEREKTIAHEEKHQQEMQAGKLDYDDDNLYYDGKAHPRKDGKIHYNGKWIKEGSKEFPWEQVAYNAEESPLRREEDEHEEGSHEDSSEFTNEHFNDPATRERLLAQTGLSNEEIDGRLEHATGIVPQQDAFLGADAEYDSGYTRGYREDGEYGDIDPSDPAYQAAQIKLGVDPTAKGNQGTLAHEQGHALGFDNKLGKVAQGILGKAKGSSASVRKYLDNPGETYGHIQELRKEIGLKGFERNLTPEKLQKLIDFSEKGENESIKRLLDNYDIKDLAKALNTVAETKKKPKKKNLRDLYSKPDTGRYA